MDGIVDNGVTMTLIEVTSDVWSIETRHDELVGVDTGWCQVMPSGEAERIQGSHSSAEHDKHVSHYWMFRMPPGSSVRVVRGYRDGNMRCVVTNDVLYLRSE